MECNFNHQMCRASSEKALWLRKSRWLITSRLVVSSFANAGQFCQVFLAEINGPLFRTTQTFHRNIHRVYQSDIVEDFSSMLYIFITYVLISQKSIKVLNFLGNFVIKIFNLSKFTLVGDKLRQAQLQNPFIIFRNFPSLILIFQF